MKWTEAASRIKGISTPFIGIEFEPAEAEARVVRRVLALLEDRRVLFAPFALESPEACVLSANQIRQGITEELGALSQDGVLRTVLQRIRQASRDFVSTIEARMGHGARNPMEDSWSAAEFGISLGQMRSIIGTYVAILSSTYRIDVDDDLAAILPPKLRVHDV